MLHIFINIVAPVVVIAGLGALLNRVKPVEPRAISRVAIYLTSPALAFYGLANASITGTELGGLVLFFFLTTATITLFAWGVSKLLKMDQLTRSALMLSMALINVGNYGIPLNEFAFGQLGMERALVISVLSAFTANTLGVFLASWGKASKSQSLINVFKVPLPYAVVLGALINLGYLPAPQFVMRVTNLLGQAAVPVMLIMLGVQVSRVSFDGQWGLMLGASLTRLMGGAVVGFLVAALLGLTGVTRQVAIVEAAMPTAVMASVLATEFDGDSKLVSSVVLLSTLLSLITLPILLYLLMN
ncbi:MAG: AEC family transporter [Anaerolineae bacterium]|nr:AEC family transporter [Anaerolineae bacterium]